MKLCDKLKEIAAEIQDLDAQIKGHEGGIIAMTGYMSSDLVRKVVEDTGKVDANGNAIRVTKYVPTDMVTFNEEDNCYYVEEVSAGSDYDIDAFKMPENPTEEGVLYN